MKRFLKRALKVMVVVDLVVLAIALVIKRLVPEHGDSRSDHFQIVCVMQGRHWTSEAGQLTSGTIITVAGGVEVDLTKAALASDGAHLRLTTLTGGVEVRVPAEWHVRIRGRAFMGANDLVGMADSPGAQELIVDCLTIMGGVQVRGVSVEREPVS